MTHMDDLQRIVGDAVVDQVWKRDNRKHPNSDHISRTPEARIFRQQLTGGPDTPHDGAGSAPVVLRYILVNAINVGAGTPGVPELHSPHFFQSAAIS